MECIEALKPSLRREILAMKSLTQQVYYDDFGGQTAINVSSGEDVFVDDLFDFSNGTEFELEEEEEGELKDSNSESSQDRENDENSNSSSFSGIDDFQSLSAGELAVPDDDLADLEWLSHFVDDTVLEFPTFYPAGGKKTGVCTPNRYEPGSKSVQMRPLCLTLSVPSKPRTKRTRTSGRVWSFLTESAPSSSLSSVTDLVQPIELYEFEKPAKKLKRKFEPVRSEESVGSQFQRRCSHCHVQKTPQWRTGPLGAKTLCNACGVRFKSGRLFPEYRPACSPTFCGDVHSNSHRKVLEMRRRKDMTGPDSDSAHKVSSF